MKYMEAAIKKAIERGYEIAPKIWGTPTLHKSKGGIQHVELRFPPDSPRRAAKRVYQEKLLLDPLFWQSLGRAEGWYNHKLRGSRGECLECGAPQCEIEWIANWHRFIDALAAGKDPELFFKELLK